MRRRPIALMILTLAYVAAALAAIGAARAPIASRAAGSSPLYFDLAIDEPRQRLYGADRAGGKIDVIALATRQVLTSIDLGAGSLPSGLDLSPGGAELAVALYGKAEIALIDPGTLTVAATLVPQDVTLGPNLPYDVIYGQPGRLYSAGSPESGGIDYIHAYDTGARQQIGRSSDVVRSAPRLAISADRATLFAGESASSPQSITSFSVITSTPTLKHVSIANSNGPNLRTLAVAPDGASVYTSMGQKWLADLSAPSPEFVIFSGSQIEYITATDQIVLSDNIAEGGIPNQIALLDASGGRFAQINLQTIAGVSAIGVTRANSAGSLLYMSTDRGIQVLALTPRAWLPRLGEGLRDDFSDPTSGWPIDEDAVVRRGYGGGEYRMFFKQGGYLVRAGRSLGMGDFDLSVDGAQYVAPGGGGLTSGSYGLYFGSGPAGFYFFELNLQTYDMYRYDSAKAAFVALVPLTGDNSIRSYGPNRLRVVRRGPQITAYINGSQVAQVSDATLGVGFVGLIASADRPLQSLPFEARFDNFLLTAPRSVPNASAAAARAASEDLAPVPRPAR